MKYKVKKTDIPQNKKTRGTLSPKHKMLLLLIWTVISVSLYMAFSARFATTTVQVCEVLVLIFLCLYFYFTLKLRGAEEEIIPKLEDKRNIILILIIPVIAIIMYDFISVSIRLFK